jgi:hypothetical protein
VGGEVLGGDVGAGLGAAVVRGARGAAVVTGAAPDDLTVVGVDADVVGTPGVFPTLVVVAGVTGLPAGPTTYQVPPKLTIPSPFAMPGAGSPE